MKKKKAKLKIDEWEALKSLYDSRISDQRFFSERQFSSTIQAITVNLIVVSGVVAGKLDLTTLAKVLATVLLGVFNFQAIIYLRAKKRSYLRVKSEIPPIEASLIALCPSLANKLSISYSNSNQGRKKKESLSQYRCRKRLKQMRDGTNIFCILILVSVICSISAIWIQIHR